MAEHSEFFQSHLNKVGSLNHPWYENEKMKLEAEKAFEHAKVDVDHGLVEKYKALRMKELDQFVNKNCYKNKQYNFAQAQRCEQYHFENDYKLGLLNSFTKDHIWKYMVDYKNCTRSQEFKSLDNIVEKDRAYQKCHDKFMKQ